MAKRQGRKSAAQTPAPRKERIYGSKKNPKGSASSEKTASKIQLSQDILKGLEKKLKEFKEKNPSKKNVTLADLKAVFRRGAGAYSKSHRPFITGGVPNSRNAWAYARVNKFLKKAAGQKVKAAYVQDDDLLKREYGGELVDKDGEIKFEYLREAEDEEVENFFDSNWQVIAKWSEGEGRGTTPHAIYTNGSQYLLEREDYGFDGYNSPQYYFVSINESFAKGGEIDPKVLRERWAKKKMH